MFQLETQMRALAETAGQLGIPLQYVTQAWKIAADELGRQHTIAVRNLYGQLEDEMGNEGLQMALFNLETRFMDLYKAANDLGVPIDRVVKAHQNAAVELVKTYDKMIADLNKQQNQLDQSLKEANRSAFQVVDQFLDPIKEATGAFGIGQGVFSQRRPPRAGWKNSGKSWN